MDKIVTVWKYFLCQTQTFIEDPRLFVLSTDFAKRRNYYYIYTTGWEISKMWLAKVSRIWARIEIPTCNNYSQFPW